MKLHISALLLASAVFARPTTMDDDDDGDSLPQTSRVTAFVIDENGNPSVQCWEFSNMINAMTINRKDGSVGAAQSLTIAKKDALEGLDIITWPPFSPIWPDPNAYSANGKVETEWLDLSASFNLFNVQGGLVNLHFSAFAMSKMVDANSDYTYQLENGDDWFYFEDKYTYSDDYFKPNAVDSPFSMSTVSGGDTEVLRLRFPQRPAYKVINKNGGCGFSGISTPSSSSAKKQQHVFKQQYEL